MGFDRQPRGDGQVGQSDGQEIDAVKSSIGCADGEREELAGELQIAGCAASWTDARNLRTAPSGSACGDDLGPCVQAADACAPGWHICASTGDVAELLEINGDQCIALVGRYIAAADHCATSAGCVYPTAGQWPCSSGVNAACIQPICCGTSCDVTTGCASGVWPGATRAATLLGAGCGNVLAATGVMCCRP